MAGFVPLKVDQDSSVNFCDRHAVEALPLVLFLDADGAEIGRRAGLQSAAELLPAMGAVRGGYAAYLDAIARAKDDPASAESAARYLTGTGNPERAIGLLRRALKAAPPERADALALALAEAQLAPGEAKDAANGFTRLAEAAAAPEIRAGALDGLARAERERGRTEEAERALRRLREEFPDRAAGGPPAE
jgi:tetratricopeptide (TPR) repeat protein